MPRRILPYLLLTGLGLALFVDLLLHPTQILYSEKSDFLAMHLPMKRFLVRSWQETGELPLWYPYSFGGMPFVHDVQVGIFYPLHWPLLLFPEERVGMAASWLVVLHVLIAGWTMCHYSGLQGYGFWGRLVASLGFMFAGKWLLHLVEAGQTILAPLAWLPLATALLEQALQRAQFLKATLAGMVFALMVLGMHPQITFYAGLFLALWTLPIAWESGPLVHGTSKQRLGLLRRPLLRWLVLGGWVATVAILLSAVQLGPALEATPEATRSTGVTTGEVLRGLTASLLQPFGPPLHWPSWETQGMFGLLWVVTAAVAPILGTGRVRFQAGICLGLMAFAMGAGTLAQALPGFRLFQLPVRMHLIVAFPLALLAGLAVDRFPTAAKDPAIMRRVRRRALALLIVLGGVFLGLPPLLLLAGGGAPRFHPYWITLIPLSVGFLALFHTGMGKSPAWQGATWCLVLTLELATLVFPFPRTRPETEIYNTPKIVERLVERVHAEAPEVCRILDRGLPQAPSSGPLGIALPALGAIRLEPVLGYNTFDVRRYRDYVQMMAGINEPVRPRETLGGWPILSPLLIENKNLLDLLGVRYILVPEAPEDRPTLPRDGRGRGEPGTHSGWQRIDQEERAQVYSFLGAGMTPLGPHALYENTEVFPRAFVVPQARPMPPHKVLETLQAADFRTCAFLEGSLPAPKIDSGGEFRKARLLQRQPHRIQVAVDEGPPGILVLTEIFYPGWSCQVDGKTAALFRANSLFQATELSAGAHVVEFVFLPESYRLGRILSLATLGIILLLGGVQVLRGWFFPPHVPNSVVS